MVTTRILAAMLLSLAIAACGKSTEPAKTAEQQKAEKDAAAKAVRENPVYGDQIKAMDKAKAVTDDAVKKTDEALKKADESK